MIVIDADKGTIDVELSDEELASRRAAWRPPATMYASGTLWKYAQTAGPAYKGAVTHPGGKAEVTGLRRPLSATARRGAAGIRSEGRTPG